MLAGVLPVIGWLACGVVLVYSSGTVFFLTVPTFGEALLSGNKLQKFFGFILWAVLLCLWGWWLSVISINL